MADAILLKQGGGGTGSEDCTALREHVLALYTAVTKDSDDEPGTGTMPNHEAVSQLLNAGECYTVPAGYHNGNGKVTANSLASQTGGATAIDGDVLSGKTFWRDGEKRTGTMSSRGAVSQTLNAGSSYTIPSGYHNGSGKVTANALSGQTSATATAANILSGQTAWVNGSKLTGTMANQGTKTSALDCGGSYTIPGGYHSGSGKVTANSLASQTSATAVNGDLRAGKTAYVNGSKVTGTLSVQSAISFSAAALSHSTIRISWKNPAKGPWQGVFVQMSTAGYPGTGGGSRAYTGTGVNPNQSGGSNYVDITGLSAGTTYYFTCTSYCDELGWGASNNISAATIGSFGTMVTLDEAGYLPLLELDSTRVIGMKTITYKASETRIPVDLCIMSTGRDGITVLGMAYKVFDVPARYSSDIISAFYGVNVIRYNENGIYLIFMGNDDRETGYRFLVNVTTTSNTITIHDMKTYSVVKNNHYGDFSYDSGYDFNESVNEYGAGFFSIQYYEEETNDINYEEFKTLVIDGNGTITELPTKISAESTTSHKHDSRMIRGGSRFVERRVTGNYDYEWNYFKSKTTSGKYLRSYHYDTAAAKRSSLAYTTMPNGAPYALISVPDGVYVYKDGNLWANSLIYNPNTSSGSPRKYIRGISLNAEMNILVVHVSTNSSTSSQVDSTTNEFQMYRFNKSNMTIGDMISSITVMGGIDGIRACGQGICIVKNPHGWSSAESRMTRYIPI